MKNSMMGREGMVWRQGMIAAGVAVLTAWICCFKDMFSESRGADLVLVLCNLLWITLCAGMTYASKLRRKMHQKREDETMNALGCLCSAIDSRDSGRPERLRKIAQCALWLGKRRGMSAEQLKEMQLSVYLHDIGKLTIPEHILHKPGPLSGAEWETVRSHPIWAARMLSEVAMTTGILNTIRHHHERWDGSGYPDGLKAEEIPLEARILAISEACEAISSPKPYRQAWNNAEFREIIKQGKGTQFDPEMVDELLQHYDDKDSSAVAFEIPFPETVLARKLTEMTAEAWSRIREAGGETATLLRVADNLSKTMCTDETLQCVIAEIKNLASYSTLVCYVLDPESGQLNARFVDGENSAAMKAVSIPYGQGATGWAIANHRAVVIDRAELDFMPEQRGLAAKYESVAVFPLASAGTEYLDESSQGALTLYLKAGVWMNAEVQRRVQELTLRVGLRLSQQILLNRAQSRSLSDPVTNLPNMRFLYAHASQELAKARRHTYPMSLVEMEIENFQKLVEQHGLETAEKMLKELAATLQRQLRNCDVLARLSENEFAVVLSMTGPSQARFLIQRLSDAAARFRFKTGSDTLDEVRVNFGCASFPENGRTAESLFLHANRDRTQSMKRSKQVWPMGVRQVRGNVIPFHIQ